jgi:hypothetical protein
VASSQPTPPITTSLASPSDIRPLTTWLKRWGQGLLLSHALESFLAQLHPRFADACMGRHAGYPVVHTSLSHIPSPPPHLMPRSLSQRRVELELRPHSDSVFSILPGAGFRSVLSASRDGTVAWSSLVPGAPREEGGAVGRDGGDLASRLLFTAGGAVHSLHTPAWSEQRLWVATTDSSILCWPLPPDVASPLHHNGDSMADSLAASPAASPHATFLLRAPCCRIAGSPAVRQLAVLPSKVHLLSEDTQGRCVAKGPTAHACKPLRLCCARQSLTAPHTLSPHPSPLPTQGDPLGRFARPLRPALRSGLQIRTAA